MRPEIPDKLYFKIGEVSKLAGVAAHVLRYWESEFPSISPQRANSQQRLYRRVDVETVLVIKTLLHEQGYTIAGARKFLASGQTVPAQPAPPRNVAGCLEQIKSELREMNALLHDKGKGKG
ncbi:MAG: MerR family transcriptional regulator [Deltaproteobacteria bacterium]|nr:MerR family transcriptional regulator [Deltaproteobacteria bacterium]